MAAVTSAEYYDKDDHKNKVSRGANRFHLVGTFSGHQKDSDIYLHPSSGTVDGSKTKIKDQTTTTIDGKYHYVKGSKESAGRGQKSSVDEDGTMESSVEGSTPLCRTEVKFPGPDLD